MFHFNATALTVNNITNTLAGVGAGWRRICLGILGLPDSKFHEIEKQFSSDEERVEAAVREWLLRDPLASWRRLIDRLYWENEFDQADSILHYAEELTGMYVIIKFMIHSTCIAHDA